MSAKKEISFETQMKKLQGLIEKLEGESLSLEDSLSTFEQAMELVKSCGLQLKQAEERIKVLTNGQEKDFNQEDEPWN